MALLPPSSLARISASGSERGTLTSALACSHGPQLCRSQLQPFLRSSFFAWEARSHLGSPVLRSILLSKEWGLVCKRTNRAVVQASLLGVGAPEALVIAVVALLVFGPRGLAEVARTLGKSLRSFQPTIKELQQISKEFKSTLEQEIGLDDLRTDLQQTQNGPIQQNVVSTDQYLFTEDQAKALVPEEQRKAAEAAAWGGTPPSQATQSEPQIPATLQAEEQISVTSNLDQQTPETPTPETQSGFQAKSSEDKQNS